MPPKVLLLISSLTSDAIQEQDQRRVRDLLNAKAIDFDELDGADQNYLEQRNALFALSKQRGKYPQVFIVEEDGTKKFIGLWEQMESLNECSQLPAAILQANPHVETFEKVFKDVKRRPATLLQQKTQAASSASSTASSSS